MKVRILRSAQPSYWYANRIGEVFEVDPRGILSLEGFGYPVTANELIDGKNDSVYYIALADCTEVTKGLEPTANVTQDGFLEDPSVAKVTNELSFTTQGELAEQVMAAANALNALPAGTKFRFSGISATVTFESLGPTEAIEVIKSALGIGLVMLREALRRHEEAEAVLQAEIHGDPNSPTPKGMMQWSSNN